MNLTLTVVEKFAFLGAKSTLDSRIAPTPELLIWFKANPSKAFAHAVKPTVFAMTPTVGNLIFAFFGVLI
jgi:hypothetical protein